MTTSRKIIVLLDCISKFEVKFGLKRGCQYLKAHASCIPIRYKTELDQYESLACIYLDI